MKSPKIYNLRVNRHINERRDLRWRFLERIRFGLRGKEQEVQHTYKNGSWWVASFEDDYAAVNVWSPSRVETYLVALVSYFYRSHRARESDIVMFSYLIKNERTPPRIKK